MYIQHSFWQNLSAKRNLTTCYNQNAKFLCIKKQELSSLVLPEFGKVGPVGSVLAPGWREKKLRRFHNYRSEASFDDVLWKHISVIERNVGIKRLVKKCERDHFGDEFGISSNRDFTSNVPSVLCGFIQNFHRKLIPNGAWTQHY